MADHRIRVLIAEDHAVVREGTRDILDRDTGIEVVGEAENGEQALSLAMSLRPDVLVLDLHLPLISGIEVARQLRARAPQIRVLVLSAYDDDEYVFAAMEAGASGYLLKTAHGEEVVGAIHSISHGEVVLQAAVAGKFLRPHERYEAAVVPEEGLTARELEILRLAAQGLRNKEIAQRLQVSRRTVEGHLAHVFAKLNVNSRTEAILFGAAHGWFALEQGDLAVGV